MHKNVDICNAGFEHVHQEIKNKAVIILAVYWHSYVSILILLPLSVSRTVTVSVTAYMNISPLTFFLSVTSCIPVRTGEAGTTLEMMHVLAGMENMNSCRSLIISLLKRSGMSCQKVSTSLCGWVGKINKQYIITTTNSFTVFSIIIFTA